MSEIFKEDDYEIEVDAKPENRDGEQLMRVGIAITCPDRRNPFTFVHFFHLAKDDAIKRGLQEAKDQIKRGLPAD